MLRKIVYKLMKLFKTGNCLRVPFGSFGSFGSFCSPNAHYWETGFRLPAFVPKMKFSRMLDFSRHSFCSFCSFCFRVDWPY